MRNATRRLIGIVTISMVTALVVAPHAGARLNGYTAELSTAPVQSRDGYPGVGGTAVLAGSVHSSRFGDGALVDHVTITGQDGNVISFEGTEVDYFARGSQRNVFEGEATIRGDGSQKLIVHGRFVGGSGRYRHARGRYRFKGSVPPGGSVATGVSIGNVRF